MNKWLAALLLPLCLTGCGNKEEQQETASPDADLLYASTLKWVRLYTDSISQAPDSLLIEIYNRFNAGLDSINFAVAPDTDLFLSEAQNDTLFMAVTKLGNLYKSRLNSYKSTLNESQLEELEEKYRDDEDPYTGNVGGNPNAKKEKSSAGESGVKSEEKGASETEGAKPAEGEGKNAGAGAETKSSHSAGESKQTATEGE